MDAAQLLHPVREALADGRLVGLVVGVVLLLFGARVYRVLVVGPGVLAGLLIANEGVHVFHLVGIGAAALSVALAVLGAVIFSMVERWTLAIVGAALSVTLLGQGWSFLYGGGPPVWAWPVAGIVGSILVPRLYRFLLKPATALAGALTLTATMGNLEGLLKPGRGAAVLGPWGTIAAVCLLALGGFAFQTWLERSGTPEPKKKAPPKRK